jgi:hypothetical protein
LVPLTAGACSPCRMSSRRIPRQTSGPDSSPHDGRGAASRRHRAPHPYLAPTPLPDGRPLAHWVKHRSAAYASVPSRFGPPPGHALKSRPGSRPVYRPFERLAHCHRRTAQAQQDQPCSTGWWADVSRKAGNVGGAAALATLHQRSLAWPGSPRERLFRVVCGHTSWLLTNGPASSNPRRPLHRTPLTRSAHSRVSRSCLTYKGGQHA